MARPAKTHTPAIAYLRTSSASNVGADKDSEKRQRQAVTSFAKRNGFELDGLPDYVRLNAKAVEFDFMLPIVAGGHALGEDGAAGLDVLEEHVTLIGWALAA